MAEIKCKTCSHCTGGGSEPPEPGYKYRCGKAGVGFERWVEGITACTWYDELIILCENCAHCSDTMSQGVFKRYWCNGNANWLVGQTTCSGYDAREKPKKKSKVIYCECEACKAAEALRVAAKAEEKAKKGWKSMRPEDCICMKCKWMDEYHPQLGWRCRQEGTWVGFKEECRICSLIVDIAPSEPILCDKCFHHLPKKSTAEKRFCAGRGRLVPPMTKCVSFREQQPEAQCKTCTHSSLAVPTKDLGWFCEHFGCYLGFNTTTCSIYKNRADAAWEAVQAEKAAIEAAFQPELRDYPTASSLDMEKKTVTITLPPGWSVTIKQETK